MTSRLTTYLPYLAVAAVFAAVVVLVACTGVLPMAALQPYLPALLYAGFYLALAVLSAVCVPLSAWLAETAHASRVARLTDTVGRVAGGIAEQLQQHPAYGSTADVLGAVRADLVAEGAQYVGAVMPDTIASVGVAPGTLTAMIDNAVSGQMLKVPPQVVAAAAGVAASAIGAQVAAALGVRAPDVRAPDGAPVAVAGAG